MNTPSLQVNCPFLIYSVLGKPLFLVFQLSLAASAISLTGIARADYPSLPLTIQLGPDAEDFNSRYKAGLIPPGSLSVLNGFDLSGRNLRQSKLHLLARELRNVNFDSADLTGSDLRETHFDSCSFRNAILRRVNLALWPNCDLTGADITGCTALMFREQLISTLNYKRKDLSGCDLSGEYDGVSFARFNLNGTRLAYSLVGCDFSDASISDSTLSLTKEQLVSTRNYGLRDLNGTTLKESDYSEMNLSGMSLGLFRKCNLSEVDFTNAFFEPPAPKEPSWPTMRNGFIHSQITREQFYSTWNYKRKYLPPGFVFFGMDVRGWDFRGMDLRGVTFTMCTLTDAQFDDARGGIFNPGTITAEQVRSMWNYKNNQMNEPGIYLHRDLAAEFSLQYSP